ncbi:hypothetical protein [Pelagicoccus sp. SDUM812002]|uniref:hypothetical protein n=1 Tax=Pelagicoccus sp. SDUM812002 TaxID=3041266 RepID=UPI00280E0C5D|nr:hypothetical protein [Pelagicoccus sp. SDUM812002]MDQ8188347.1 hypothetical protein [Pelagicoccus sp. SDUM812002]
MIKFVFKFLIVGLVVLLGFYFFMGSPEDKARAKAVIAKAGDFMGELGNFVKAEKEKFDRGEYEKELEKIRELAQEIRAKASDFTSFQESSAGVQTTVLDRKVDSLQELASKEDLTDEEILELERRLRELQSEANDLAGEAGTSDLPKLL